LSRNLPTVPVVIGKRRAREAEAFLEAGADVGLFLLDDGFQHRSLGRDRDVVLLDLERPLDNGRLLPAGALRESPAALRRAHHLLFTAPDRHDSLPAETDSLRRTLAPQATFSRAWTTLTRLAPLAGSEAEAPPTIQGLTVLAVAGIARPRRLQSLLVRAGMNAREGRCFRDHHRFTRREVRQLERDAEERGAHLVTTAKDAVRLEGLTSPGAKWLVAETSLRVEEGWNRLLKEQLPQLFA
jgi:tetraacyldisaccharide 4'-kinase